LPMDVPAPAVAAAIFRATGLFMPELPILPERLAAAYQARQQTAPADERTAPVARRGGSR
jgi:hypothetical protein